MAGGLFQKIVGFGQTADHRGQQIHQVGFQNSFIVGFLKIGRQPYRTSFLFAHQQLPHPELMPNEHIEHIGFLAGMNLGVTHQKSLEPCCAAAGTPYDKDQIFSCIVQHFHSVSLLHD